MTDQRKVSIWAAALQDHYFASTSGNGMSSLKTARKQRQKWEREAKRRQNFTQFPLPKIKSGTYAASAESCGLTSPQILPHPYPPIPSLTPDIALDKAPKITLAQKIGIVSAPKQLLSKSDWSKVKEKARVAHATYRTDCAICCEPFAALSQVVLSCSHSFHQACIQSYERHTNSKRCPLCRTRGYETLLTSDAAEIFYQDAATKIQSVWRMFVCRKKYLKHRRENEPANPLLKRRFHMERLGALNQALGTQLQEDGREMERVFAEMDLSLQISKAAFDKLANFHEEIVVDWDTVVDKLYQRKKNPLQDPCSICLCELVSCTDETAISKKRDVAILSCGHLMHHKCISSFENFNKAQLHICPVCRSKYARTYFPTFE